jgi:hypothetical protein
LGVDREIRGRRSLFTMDRLMKFREAPESIRALRGFSALSSAICRVVKKSFFDSVTRHSTILHLVLVDAHAVAIDLSPFPIPILSSPPLLL